MSRNLYFLFAALFLWGIGEGMFFNFNPLYLQSLGASPIVIGGILGAFGMIMAVAHPPAGFLADKIGRIPLIRTAWVIGAFSAFTMAMATDLPVFIAGILLYGLTAFVSSPLSSYAAAASGHLSVGRVLTFTSSFFNAGLIFGPLIGGWLGDTFGLRTVYWAALVLFVLSNLFIFLLHRQPVERHDADSPPPLLLRNERYLGFLLISFAVTFALYLGQPLTPNFLQNERGLTFGEIGIISSAGGLGNAVLSILLGGIGSARIGYMLAQACVAVFALLLWQGQGVWMYAAGYFLLGGFRVARSLGAAQVRGLIHSTQMGLAFGLFESVNALPIILGPLLAGRLYEQDPALIYPLVIGLVAVTIAITFFFGPRSQPQEQIRVESAHA